MKPSILGFSWDSTIISTQLPDENHKANALFRVKKLLPEFVWNTTVLEDNPFTFPEVKTLLDGVTIGGHALSDEQQVLNQARSLLRLLDLVKHDQFAINKMIFCELNSIVAFEEALKWGVFRDGPVSIAGTTYKPSNHEKLDEIFKSGCDFLLSLNNVMERSLVFFLFGAYQQFFYDGNKRTARLMMNGELLRHGYDAISIPAARKQEFNEKMMRFYANKDGTEMIRFLLNISEILTEV